MRNTLTNLTKSEWESWKNSELERVKNILDTKGIELTSEQSHLLGERYLMSGKKLVLTGFWKSDNKKVIIKYSSDPELKKEIEDERERKKTLETINFGYKSLSFPTESFYDANKEWTMLVTEFIEEESVFVKLPLEKQFFLSLKVLETFESVHSVVNSHARDLKSLGSVHDAKTYFQDFKKMKANTEEILGEKHPTVLVLNKVEKELAANINLVEKFCDFLTHDDFVPHNMRVKGDDVVVLDHSSLIIGNKYESWARFLNFVLIFNFPLERLLNNFVKENRPDEEYKVLNLMRLFKITLLVNFYAKSTLKSEGKLKILQETRLSWWTKILEKILNEEVLTEDLSMEHLQFLEDLRSDEEKKRHKEISG